MPIPRTTLGDLSATGSFDPFKHAIEESNAGLNQLLIALGCVGGALVVLIVAFATAAHVHPSTRELVFGDTPARAHMWASLDMVFSFVHFTPKGNVLRRRGTSFGGMVSLACSVAIIVLSAMLATKNLLNPNYTQSVSADALAANPLGTFRLRARVFGGGDAFSSACAGMSITAQSDSTGASWLSVSNGIANATRPAVASSDTSGRSCLLEWNCEQCQLSGSVSSTVLSLRSTLPSWVTYANFTFEAPPFVIAGATRTAAPVAATASSGIGGAGGTFSTFGSVSPQPAALRGAATLITISLIGVDAQTQTGDRAVAFSSLVSSVVIPSAAATTEESSFDFGSGNGFQIDFILQRSQTVIVWCVHILHFSECSRSTSSQFNIYILILQLRCTGDWTMVPSST